MSETPPSNRERRRALLNALLDQHTAVRARLPLRRGIHFDLCAEGHDPGDVCAVLAKLTACSSYLKACVEGAVRVNLDGSPSDQTVTEAEAINARERLDARKAEKSAAPPERPRRAPEPRQRDRPVAAPDLGARLRAAAAQSTARNRPVLNLRRSAPTRSLNRSGGERVRAEVQTAINQLWGMNPAPAQEPSHE
jgi:sRNA-binding protein